VSDRIEKTITIAAPIARVWEALTDHRQFGAWFRVALDQPFTVGGPSTGQTTYPGYEHLKWNALVEEMTAPTRFVLRWPAGADDAQNDPVELWTTVAFTLATEGDGTRITVVESGFDKVPAARRAETIRMNTSGWEEQMTNIKSYVEG
jgi:uncharacterized protein YndB with AHSA1/START domain